MVTWFNQCDCTIYENKTLMGEQIGKNRLHCGLNQKNNEEGGRVLRRATRYIVRGLCFRPRAQM
jgi:hypothetical protein